MAKSRQTRNDARSVLIWIGPAGSSPEYQQLAKFNLFLKKLRCHSFCPANNGAFWSNKERGCED